MSKSMQFSGNTLQRIRDALDLADSELHNQIATCPNVIDYEELKMPYFIGIDPAKEGSDITAVVEYDPTTGRFVFPEL